MGWKGGSVELGLGLGLGFSWWNRDWSKFVENKGEERFIPSSAGGQANHGGISGARFNSCSRFGGSVWMPPWLWGCEDRSGFIPVIALAFSLAKASQKAL